MLSYQHDYHAGNHADVFKHWLLLEIITYLQLKPAAVSYIDTHAGSGCYALDGELAAVRAEHRQGIDLARASRLAGMSDFLARVDTSLEAGYYPGSALLFAQALREHDAAWLFELHPQAFSALGACMAAYRRSKIHLRQQDGIAGLRGLLPTAQKRALVMIDPSWEVKSDYHAIPDAVAAAWQRMPNAIFAIWYPVLDPDTVDRLVDRFAQTAIRNVVRYEFQVSETGPGMYGSGMIVINPPWTLTGKVRELLPELSRILAVDGRSRWRCDRISAE